MLTEVKQWYFSFRQLLDFRIGLFALKGLVLLMNELLIKHSGIRTISLLSLELSHSNDHVEIMSACMAFPVD